MDLKLKPSFTKLNICREKASNLKKGQEGTEINAINTRYILFIFIYIYICINNMVETVSSLLAWLCSESRAVVCGHLYMGWRELTLACDHFTGVQIWLCLLRRNQTYRMRLQLDKCFCWNGLLWGLLSFISSTSPLENRRWQEELL